MSTNRKPMNLRDVYENTMMTEWDKQKVVAYWSKLQDLIRRKCNDNADPNPFLFNPDRNSEEISLESVYESKLECVKEVVHEFFSDIPGLREKLLNWLK